MENGFIRLPRALFKSAAYSAPRQFSPFEAYLDLFQLAQWRSFQYFTRGRYIPLEPGDVLTTSPRLAKRWKWPREEVRAWLKHLRKHRVLSCEVVEGLLRISLDAYCHARFAQAAAPALSADGGEGGVHSSEENKEETSSVSRSSFSSSGREQNEERKDEDGIIDSNEERKNEEEKSDSRASGIAEQLVKSVVDHARPRHAANDFHESSERRAELREQCEVPPTRKTDFPPDFPMDEFRRYVDDALRSPDKSVRPHLHHGWLAELRDRFLAERSAA